MFKKFLEKQTKNNIMKIMKRLKKMDIRSDYRSFEKEDHGNNFLSALGSHFINLYLKITKNDMGGFLYFILYSEHMKPFWLQFFNKTSYKEITELTDRFSDTLYDFWKETFGYEKIESDELKEEIDGLNKELTELKITNRYALQIRNNIVMGKNVLLDSATYFKLKADANSNLENLLSSEEVPDMYKETGISENHVTIIEKMRQEDDEWESHNLKDLESEE